MNLFNPANSIEKDTQESKYFVINSQQILTFKNENFVRPISADELNWSGLEIKKKHFLGYLNDNACFAVSTLGDCVLEDTVFSDLRSLLGRIPDDLFSVISRAIQIQNWYETHKFCGKCGAKLVEDEKERAMICNSCDAPPAYPRISPCVITLIHRDDEILLAHNVNFPENFYSTLAGFIEPGESIEGAVARETYEETGILVKNVKYVTSQPWPFPASLMIGCTAEATSHDITVDKDELEEDNSKKTPVTAYAKTRHPQVVIAGDDDRRTEGNPGRTKAEAAAKAHGC